MWSRVHVVLVVAVLGVSAGVAVGQPVAVLGVSAGVAVGQPVAVLGVSAGVAVAVLGVSAGVAVGQPAAETELDAFRTQLDRHLARNEFRAALGVMDEMVLLQAERGAALPEEFSWQYAQVARSTGNTLVTISALRHYLALAGPSGKHYKEARRMLDDIEMSAGFDCFFNSRWPTCPPTWSDLHAR